MQAIAESPGNVQAALERFEKRRLPDLHALYALDLTASARSGFSPTLGRWHPWALIQTFHTKLGFTLGKHLPGRSRFPEILRISSERLPFREVNRPVPEKYSCKWP